MLDEGIFDMQKYVDGGWVTGLKYDDEVLEDLKKRTAGKADQLRCVSSVLSTTCWPTYHTMQALLRQAHDEACHEVALCMLLCLNMPRQVRGSLGCFNDMLCLRQCHVHRCTCYTQALHGVFGCWQL